LIFKMKKLEKFSEKKLTKSLILFLSILIIFLSGIFHEKIADFCKIEKLIENVSTQIFA